MFHSIYGNFLFKKRTEFHKQNRRNVYLRMVAMGTKNSIIALTNYATRFLVVNQVGEKNTHTQCASSRVSICFGICFWCNGSATCRPFEKPNEIDFQMLHRTNIMDSNKIPKCVYCFYGKIIFLSPEGNEKIEMFWNLLPIQWILGN